MALVMLPCDLPWWGQVQAHLTKLQNTRNSLEVVETMQKIHDLCNISLDPDEDIPDPNLFVGFLNFLDNDLTSEERNNFFNHTLKSLVRRALNLKQWKPRGGLHFSLQQQPDCTELDYNFVSALIANAFFSTFPKRTHKSHPTLQNFNFTSLFKTLNDGNCQKAKLRSVLHYFDWLECEDKNSVGGLRILRQVMSSKEWLTIEDWLECSLPLCPVQIKHESRLERANLDTLHVCFSSCKLGGDVLGNGCSQECVNFTTFPEMLSVLLNVEALEDNEVLTVDRARQISRINDPKNRAAIEKLNATDQISVCCMDAEDYTKLPISQYEEDNILRELNKCLLAYQQKQPNTNHIEPKQPTQTTKLRRLSPIGESVSSTPPETSINIPMITQESCSTNKSDSPPHDNNNFLLNDKLKGERSLQKQISRAGMLNNRRGRFIVLGSSGEHLPVTRQAQESGSSRFSSCESSEEEFHSAKTSLDGDGSGDEEIQRKNYDLDLETKETRCAFAQRLKDALRREAQQSTTSSSSDSSYAVGISVTGSGIEDQNIKLRRGGSRGFVLQEESLDEDFLNDSLSRERQWIDKFKTKQSALSKKESSRSSDYSFSTEYSSELEEVYEQFSRWLEDPILETDKGTKKQLNGRDLAVVQFAGSLLKRTLSESFAGVPVPLTEACSSSSGCEIDFKSNPKNKLVLNAKSLSLELAKHKHRLAAQLINATSQALDDNDDDSDSTSSLSLTSQLLASSTNTSSLIITTEQQQNVNKKMKNNKNWTVYIVTSIVQTLEDVCVNIAKPQIVELSQIAQRPTNGLKPVSTGNWGCGSSRGGDVQLKVIVQWLAASVAGIPLLIYYTAGHRDLVKFDTIVRILIDRKWSVKDLTQAALRYAAHVIHGHEEVAVTLFDDIIGV